MFFIPTFNQSKPVLYSKEKPSEHVGTHIEHLMSALHEFSVKADPCGVILQSKILVPLRVRLSGSVFFVGYSTALLVYILGKKYSKKLKHR